MEASLALDLRHLKVRFLQKYESNRKFEIRNFPSLYFKINDSYNDNNNNYEEYEQQLKIVIYLSKVVQVITKIGSYHLHVIVVKCTFFLMVLEEKQH